MFNRLMSAPQLAEFTKAMLEEYEFPGTDAAVVFLPEGQTPSAEVREVFRSSGQQQWYPLPGGHRGKVPWHFAEGVESLFEREEKGWDHEHCDFCGAHVYIGEQCWTSETGEGGFWLFCRDCFGKLRDE